MSSRSVLTLMAALSLGTAPTARADVDSPIRHVVVIFQENVSFDHYFGTYPIAANLPGEPPFSAAAGTLSPNGLHGTLLTANPNARNPKNGTGATDPFRLNRSQAATADQNHGYRPEQTAFDNGAMDLFPYAVGRADSATLAVSTGASSVAATKGLDMGYYDGNTVTALWNYAQHYALNDHSFGTTFGPSTVGAVNLVSGQTNGVSPTRNASLVVVDVADQRIADANALPGVAVGTLHAQGRCGYGPRLPLLVISPWAKKNYIDSTLTRVKPAEPIRVTSSVPICLLRSRRKTDCCRTT